MPLVPLAKPLLFLQPFSFDAVVGLMMLMKLLFLFI